MDRRTALLAGGAALVLPHGALRAEAFPSHALARYNGFTNRGFRVTMLFDNDPTKVGQRVGDLEIQNISTLAEKVKQNKIKIAMLTVPAPAAQEITVQLVKAGIKAILNYAPINLNVPSNVGVQYIDPVAHLQRMKYYLD